jgi:hypothetical protein
VFPGRYGKTGPWPRYWLRARRLMIHFILGNFVEQIL